MTLDDLYRLLRSSHVQAQGIVDTIDEPLLVLDESGCVIEANRAFFGTFMVERDDTIGVPLRELGDKQWDIPELTRLIAEILPRSTAVVDYEVTHQFPKIGLRTFLLTARRLWKPDNNSTQILLVFEDVTEIHAKQRENSLLFSEMRHRLTNLLGIVRALADQTETKGRTAEEYKAAFLGRFEALLTAHSLMAGGGSAVSLKDLVTAVAGGLGGSQLRLAGGPDVSIGEPQVVPLTMVLHELGTNALKYGGFAQENGTVEVSWDIVPKDSGSRSFRLVWRETSPSPVAPRSRTGVGTQVIEGGAEFALRGSAKLDFEPGGLVATLTVPMIEDRR
jgi:two-component sensor histidine kinase